jgi:hypothetical protein
LESFLDETQADELIITSNPYEHAARLHSYEIIAEIAREAVAQNGAQPSADAVLALSK